MLRLFALIVVFAVPASTVGCTSRPAADKPGGDGPSADAKDKPTAEKPRSTAAKPAKKEPFVYAQAMGKDGRLYVFSDEKNKKHFDQHGEFLTEKFITKIGYGPKGETVRFQDDAAMTEYEKRKASAGSSKAPTAFVYAEAMGKDGRLYVFSDEKNKKHFDQHGEFLTEKFITKIGHGPKGETVRFQDDAAMTEYEKRRKGG